jgi:inner membrane protein
LDNITHSLAGWVLGQPGLKSTTRKGLAALILGANMPDIDVFLGWAPWGPLAMHRGFTHSLVGGIVLMPPMLFALLWLLDRWQVRRGTQFRSGLPMRPWWLLGLCYLATITHPLLDMLTTYSVQLFTPFSNAWYHADALFIIDVWIWLILGGSIAWSKWREKRGRAWRKPVQAAIAIVLAYIAANLLISERAVAAVHNWAGRRPVEAVFASPPPLAFWRRDLVWREDGCYRRSRFGPLRGLASVSNCQPTHMSDPLVRRAIQASPRLQKFLRWSILPQARIVRSGCKAHVSISDARYGPPSDSRLSRETIVSTC